MIWPFTRGKDFGEIELQQMPVRIQPMPQIRAAKIYLPDIMRAVGRADEAWNETQFRDALRAVENFLAASYKALEKDVESNRAPAQGTGGQS